MDFIEVLQKHLDKFKTVLELGSKQGKDLELLHGFYEVVASENEKTKTRFLKDKFLDIRVILIDFIELDSHKRFDCIFSRNIYDECSIEDIKSSLENQRKLLNEDGLIFHIFDEEKVSRNQVIDSISGSYKILEEGFFESDFYILAKLI